MDIRILGKDDATEQRTFWAPCVLWAFFLSRFWVVFFAYWAHAQRPFLKPVVGGWIGVGNWWLNPWTTYDSERFIRVAEHGYNIATSPSFPLYSILLTPFRQSEVLMALAGVVISNTAFLLALAFLYKLTQRDFNASVAHLTVWVTAFFPATVIFSAVYAESLFLLLVVLTFWFARKATNKGWLWAAFVGLLAGLTRNSGPILFVALLIEYSMQRKHSMQRKAAVNVNGETLSPWCALATTTPLLAFVGFQLYLKSVLGGGDLMLKQQHLLGRDWMWPWMPIVRDFWAIVGHGYTDTAYLVNLWATLMGLFLAVTFWKRGRLSYTAFLGGVLLSFLLYGVTYTPVTLGAVRYLAMAFPMQQRLAMWIAPLLQRPRTKTILILFALAASALVAFNFGQKNYLF